jgi:F0F1-type ATP synthase membrane subunit b/b'
MRNRKNINVTFSIPENINMLLHSFVEKRGLSKFVTKAIEKALEEERNNLKAAFKDAENDPDLKETMADWAALDGDVWDE